MMQKFSLVEPNAHAEVKLCWGAAGLSQIFMSMTSKRRTRQNLIDYVAKSNEFEKCQRIELAHFVYILRKIDLVIARFYLKKSESPSRLHKNKY